jgi:3-oxoacyl-[acyl-carrier-protein] synthase II
MKAYITASSVISPQPTHGSEGFPSLVTEIITNRLKCIEPEYKNYINPLHLRRMPRILKMGLATSQLCINQAGGVKPDGIIVGTGLGCLESLEKFMSEVIDQDEHVTSVLAFINSTHNAVAAQVAMLLKNHNYNLTYCHRSFSFESALQDALMLIGEGKADNVLTGGIDECTEDFMKLNGYLSRWKNPLNNLRLLADHSPGSIAGEGAAFFMLSSQPQPNMHQTVVRDVHTFILPAGSNHRDVESEVNSFIAAAGLKPHEIDGVMLGLNGDARNDEIYYSLCKQYFSDTAHVLYYKHLCGEYYTASAFALWLASTILVSQTVPETVLLNRGNKNDICNILIYNHFNFTEHSLILLSNEQL